VSAPAVPFGTSALTVPSPVAVAVRERVREAAAARTPLRIVGGGAWLDAGRPVAADAERLDVGAHAGIIEYEPGDLTLTAKAGTTLAEIQAAARAHGQWLGLDPWGDDAGTLGATVATGSYGPLAHAFGTPRDNVLGVEFVTGDGRVARGGGRVVKNVAGFDLTRLMTGAWGTLGVLTEVTVRLRPVPEVDETVGLNVPGGLGSRAGLARLLARLREAPIAPLALELYAPRPRVGPLVIARLAGNEALVGAQRRALAAIGDVGVPYAVMHAVLRRGEHLLRPGLLVEMRPTVVARLSRRPSRLAETWEDAVRVAERMTEGNVQASIGRGVVRLAAAAGETTIRNAFADLLRADDPPRVVFERLPPALWPELAPSAASDRLSRGVRDAFDPHRMLNPGILGE
jgi:glycolate oxidase FAD binding subunit